MPPLVRQIWYRADLTRSQRFSTGHCRITPCLFLLPFWNLVSTMGSFSPAMSTQDTILLLASQKRIKNVAHKYLVRIKTRFPVRTVVLSIALPSVTYCKVICLYPVLNWWGRSLFRLTVLCVSKVCAGQNMVDDENIGLKGFHRYLSGGN